MKKLIYTLCLFTGMAISSCEDWLARDPLDQIADVNLTYTADECKLYVSQFYTSFWGSPNNYIIILTEVRITCLVTIIKITKT
jgi:hypothetical protein